MPPGLDLAPLLMSLVDTECRFQITNVAEGESFGLGDRHYLVEKW
jgi:hypothetical protein